MSRMRPKGSWTICSVFSPTWIRNFFLPKSRSFAEKDDELARWIDETLENKAVGLLTWKEYETRVKEAEMMEKYSGQVII